MRTFRSTRCAAVRCSWVEPQCICARSARAMERLSQLEQDALEDVLRARVERSSAQLGELPGWRSTVRFERCGPSAPVRAGALWSVHQTVFGDLEGEGCWYVAEDAGLRLFRGSHSKLAGTSAMTPLEREGMTEVGNILIDGLLSGLTATLGFRLGTAAPKFCWEAIDEGRAAVSGVAIELVHLADGESLVSYLNLSCTAETGARFRQALCAYAGLAPERRSRAGD